MKDDRRARYDLLLAAVAQVIEAESVDLFLCAQKRPAVAHYALEGLPNKVLAVGYRTTLPAEETEEVEVQRAGTRLRERSDRRCPTRFQKGGWWGTRAGSAT